MHDERLDPAGRDGGQRPVQLRRVVRRIVGDIEPEARRRLARKTVNRSSPTRFIDLSSI